MPTGTSYKPASVNDFEASKLTYNGQSASTTIPPGTTVAIDLEFTEDHLLTGIWAVVGNGSYGDKISILVYDASGVFTGTPGTILSQFITDWYLSPNMSEQFDIQYPAKILGGMGLRAIYTSRGTEEAFAAMNFKLHRVLV